MNTLHYLTRKRFLSFYGKTLDESHFCGLCIVMIDTRVLKLLINNAIKVVGLQLQNRNAFLKCRSKTDCQKHVVVYGKNQETWHTNFSAALENSRQNQIVAANFTQSLCRPYFSRNKRRLFRALLKKHYRNGYS